MMVMARKKRKASASVKARLKALRRKHGLGEFRKSSSRKSKTIKRRRHSTFTMARRKRSRRRSSSRRSMFGLGSITGNPIIRKAALGMGGATLAVLAAQKFAPQHQQTAKMVGAFALGGIEGVVINELVNRMNTTAPQGSSNDGW